MGNACPQCSSKAFKKNGYTRHGKQNHRCLDCGKQFSLEPQLTFPDEVDFNTLAGLLAEANTVGTVAV